jgi:hypothetical protein
MRVHAYRKRIKHHVVLHHVASELTEVGLSLCQRLTVQLYLALQFPCVNVIVRCSVAIKTVRNGEREREIERNREEEVFPNLSLHDTRGRPGALSFQHLNHRGVYHGTVHSAKDKK